MQKYLILWIVFIIGTEFSFCNDISICGTVYEKSEIGESYPLPGAKVILKEFDLEIYTDLEGKFCIDVSDSSAILEVSFYGFETKEINSYDIIASNKIFLIEAPYYLENIDTVPIPSSVDGIFTKTSSSDQLIFGPCGTFQPTKYRKFKKYIRTNKSIHKITICGTVYDDSDIGKGQPLQGACIVITGTTIMTVTDQNGNFCIAIPNAKVFLQISSVGLETKHVSIKDFIKTYEVRLIEDYI